VEEKSIRDLIHAVEINPFNINWQHFLVAVDRGARFSLVGME